MRIHVLRIISILLVLLCLAAVPCPAQDKVTILYDAFGESKELTKDWGFSALVEHHGKRILFDTGNDAAIFEHNVKALGVDLTKLDFVVISHRHADHTTGLRYVLKVNPGVTVYVPADGGNGFGGADFPKAFLKDDDSLPANMKYFGGTTPEHFAWGKLYDTGNFVLVSQTMEVSPGISLVRTVSQKKGTLELPELTLAIKRPNGLLLVTAPVEEIDVLAENLKTKWKVQKIAPGHCTGELAFARLKKAYGENYLYAGLGTAVALE